MNQPQNQTVLAFMAHPDDAEFFCAGTLIRLAEAGWQVHVATATPGDCGTTTETRWAISARRTGEAKKAAALIGAAYHCLGERDGLGRGRRYELESHYWIFRGRGAGLTARFPGSNAAVSYG